LARKKETLTFAVVDMIRHSKYDTT